jgi:hypothetical protein
VKENEIFRWNFNGCYPREIALKVRKETVCRGLRGSLKYEYMAKGN